MMRCSICQHPQREAIESAILAGAPYRDIAGQHGLSKTSVGRHRQHLPTTLVKAREAIEVAHADSLLEKVLALHRRAEDILAGAERDGLLETALKAMREARASLELIARLGGALREAQVNFVNIDLDAQTAARMAETFLERRRSRQGAAA